MVQDYSDTSYHSRKQKLKRGGMWYTAQSGIWQTVWMEWVPIHYIEDKITLISRSHGGVEVKIHKNFWEGK